MNQSTAVPRTSLFPWREDASYVNILMRVIRKMTQCQYITHFKYKYIFINVCQTFYVGIYLYLDIYCNMVGRWERLLHFHVDRGQCHILILPFSKISTFQTGIFSRTLQKILTWLMQIA